MTDPIWRWVAGVWAAIHVEDQGAYSIERLETLSTFASDTSRTRVTAILLLTPVPAALITLSIELVQLQDPSKGVDGNGMFWLRGFLFVFVVNFAVLAQARAIILRLPMTNRQLVMFAAITTAGAVASTYALALVIGFPLPFTLLCGSPACSALLLIYGAVLWRKFLSDNPRERRELWSYVLVVANQLVMTYVYPGYLFVFQQLAPIYLAAATVFMPAIKLAMKIWIGYVFRGKDDLKPEMIVFNAEIYHALFISWCLQGAFSPYAIAGIITIDLVEAVVMARSIEASRREIYAVIDRTASRKRGVARASSVPLLRLALLLWQDDPTIYGDKVRVGSYQSRPSVASITPIVPLAGSWHSGKLVVAPTTGSVGHLPGSRCLRSMAQPTRPCSDSELLGLIRRMPHADRRLVLTQTLKVLHVTEFLLLVEYTEVIVPFVYCLYELVVYHMPNWIYFTNLRGQDEAMLVSNLANVVLYALLELASVLALSVVLGRRLGVAAIHQLAFVLQLQWRFVQCKLAMWLVIAVQAPLEHVGNDFSFKFTWLHTK